MRGLGPAICLLLCCSLVHGQSLIELAKKEKERRKANAAAGKKTSMEVEGGPPREGGKRKGAERPPTREEMIDELVQEAETLKRETDRKLKECKQEMQERGYREISDNLASCAEAKELHAQRNEILGVIQDLKKTR